MRNLEDNTFDVTYSRTRGDVLIIGRHLFRLGTVAGDVDLCFVFHRVDQAYTGAVVRLELALASGGVSDFDAAPMREQLDALIQGQSTLRAYYGGCEP